MNQMRTKTAKVKSSYGFPEISICENAVHPSIILSISHHPVHIHTKVKLVVVESIVQYYIDVELTLRWPCRLQKAGQDPSQPRTPGVALWLTDESL